MLAVCARFDRHRWFYVVITCQLHWVLLSDIVTIDQSVIFKFQIKRMT